MKCIDRGAVYQKPYCKRNGGYCDTWRWAWCKGVILGIFMALSIGWFAYGIVFAWQYAEDRVDVQRKLRENQVAATMRMNELESKLQEMDKTIVKKWQWDNKRKEEVE